MIGFQAETLSKCRYGQTCYEHLLAELYAKLSVTLWTCMWCACMQTSSVWYVGRGEREGYYLQGGIIFKTLRCKAEVEWQLFFHPQTPRWFYKLDHSSSWTWSLPMLPQCLYKSPLSAWLSISKGLIRNKGRLISVSYFTTLQLMSSFLTLCTLFITDVTAFSALLENMCLWMILIADRVPYIFISRTFCDTVTKLISQDLQHFCRSMGKL